MKVNHTLEIILLPMHTTHLHGTVTIRDFPEKEKKQCHPDFKLHETNQGMNKHYRILSRNTFGILHRCHFGLPSVIQILKLEKCILFLGLLKYIPMVMHILQHNYTLTLKLLATCLQIDHLWDPNEVQQHNNNQQYDLSPQQEMNARQFTDFEESSYIPQCTNRYRDNEYNWPLVYEIYGTAIGIILKCMSKEITIQGIPTTDVFRQDKWLQEQGLPYPTTRWILDRYYYQDTFFHQVGERVTLGARKRRELKDKIKVGVEARMWPGDTDFSELRNTCEILRRKALEFLERWGDLFEKEWVAMRQRRDY